MSMVFYETEVFFRCWIKEMCVPHRNQERNFCVHNNAIARRDARHE